MTLLITRGYLSSNARDKTAYIYVWVQTAHTICHITRYSVATHSTHYFKLCREVKSTFDFRSVPRNHFALYHPSSCQLNCLIVHYGKK